jgi:hypothetical protein
LYVASGADDRYACDARNQPDCLGFAEASGRIDGGAIGQRHNGRQRHGLSSAGDILQGTSNNDDFFVRSIAGAAGR